MSTEQFQWLEYNTEREDLSGFSVYIVEDKIDFAWSLASTVIGVVTDPIDPLDPNWATVQIQGRAHVYQTCYKPTNWIKIKSNSKVGPHGPMDEYFIR